MQARKNRCQKGLCERDGPLESTTGEVVLFSLIQLPGIVLCVQSFDSFTRGSKLCTRNLLI